MQVVNMNNKKWCWTHITKVLRITLLYMLIKELESYIPQPTFFLSVNKWFFPNFCYYTS